jgi:hypothetical protein
MFYTYSHATPEGRIFYIGKGQGGRAYANQNRNTYWHNTVKKHGTPTVQILADWETEKDAFSHEVLLISCFRAMGYKLTNLTNGGEGGSGYKHTDEQREKNKQSKLGSTPWNKGVKGQIAWNKGVPLKEETKQKISAAKIGSIPWCKGISSGLKHTEEFKQKLSNLHKGNKWRQGLPTSAKQKAIASALSKGNKHAAGNANNRKWVWIGTHIKTGVVVEFIGEQALKEAGIQHANVIKCINGKRKSHKGYTWHRKPWGIN